MYVDAYTNVWDATALSASAASSSIDMGSVAADIARGEPLGFCLTVDVAADYTTTDETYAFEVVSDTTADLATPTTLFSRTLTAAQLVAGARFIFPVPPEVAEQYVGMHATLGGTTPSVTVTAFLAPLSMLSLEPEHYPVGSVIS